MITIPAWLLLVAMLCFPFYAIFDLVWRTVDNYLRFKCENSVPPKVNTNAIGFEIPNEYDDGHDEEDIKRTNTRRKNNLRRNGRNGHGILYTTAARIWKYCRRLLLERPRRN